MTGPAASAPNAAPPDKRKLTLVHVLVMFRHGDRSPITNGVGTKLSMASDEQQFWISRLAGYELIHELSSGTRVVLTHPNTNDRANDSIDDPPSPRHGGQWPCGQLTVKGVSEMTAKGRALRLRYTELLENADPQRDLYVHSTNIRRTIRSAQCILAGMFPDQFHPAHTNLDHAIRIHVDETNSLAPAHSYALFRDLDRLLADDLRFRAPPGLRQTADRIRELTGLDKSRLIPWSALREILVCRREHGLPLPDGFDLALFDRIHELDAWLWHTLYGKREFCASAFRLGVQRFHDRVTSIHKKETSHKMTLFSAHDNSLVALMRALQLQIDRVIPHYGGMLTFEFYEEAASGELFVQAAFEHEPVAFYGHEHAMLCPEPPNHEGVPTRHRFWWVQATFASPAATAFRRRIIKIPTSSQTSSHSDPSAGPFSSPLSFLMTTPSPPGHAPVPAEKELTLRHVLFFHRHGDRSPILTQIGSRWHMTPDEMAFWGTKLATPAQLAALDRVAVVVGDDPSMPPHSVPRHRDIAPLAQLTAHGVDHMTAKGRALRTTYATYIKTHGLDTHPHEHVFVLSSNLDRTIQSVQCLLRGMFYPEDLPSSNEKEEAPVFYVRTQAINYLAPAHPITIFNKVEDIVRHEIDKRTPADRCEMEELGNKLREIVGVPADKNVPWTAIRDGLTCRKAHNLPFPEGITDAMYATMCEYDSWLWHQLFGQKEFCFNAYEHGVRQVFEFLTSITDKDKTSKPKMSFFSAHDNSIVALLSALQLQVDRILPGYGTIITFHVYEHTATQTFYLKTLFEGTPVVFAGHEHSALCAFEHFEKLALEFLHGPAKN